MYGKSKLYFSNISWVGAESAPTYNKQRVQGKSPLLEQHLDGDISNAYLAVAGDWYIRRNIVWAGKDIEDSGYIAGYVPWKNWFVIDRNIWKLPFSKIYSILVSLEIKEEVEVCMMIKDSIDDEKVSRQKQFDRFCYYLGGVKQLLDKKAA